MNQNYIYIIKSYFNRLFNNKEIKFNNNYNNFLDNFIMLKLKIKN